MENREASWNELFQRMQADEVEMTSGNQMILDLKNNICMTLLMRQGFSRDAAIVHIGFHGIDEVYQDLLISANGIPERLVNSDGR